MPDTAGRQHADTIRALRERADKGRRIGLTGEYLTLPPATQEALYAIAGELEEAADLLDALAADAAAAQRRLRNEAKLTEAAYRELGHARARTDQLEQALRRILLIAAPAWTECPAKDGWHEPYGDIAGMAEEALGQTFIDARAALAPPHVNDGADYDTWEMATGAEGTA